MKLNMNLTFREVAEKCKAEGLASDGTFALREARCFNDCPLNIISEALHLDLADCPLYYFNQDDDRERLSRIVEIIED